MNKQLLFGIGSVLLSLSLYSQENHLIFYYDEAGNETDYIIPVIKSNDDQSEELRAEEELSIEELLSNQFTVSPNPTRGEVILQWLPGLQEEILNIQLISIINSETINIELTDSHSVAVDLSNKPAGLYILIFYLKNKDVPTIQKKIIKY